MSFETPITFSKKKYEKSSKLGDRMPTEMKKITRK